MAKTTNLALSSASKLAKELDALFPSGSLRARVKSNTFSATPAFSFADGDVQKMTLTGNVTSSTLTGGAEGQRITFVLTQDGTGNRTFAWPANVIGGQVPAGAAAAVHVQSFVKVGSNWHAEFDLDTDT